MKRLQRKIAEYEDDEELESIEEFVKKDPRFQSYNEVIKHLMSNDRNATWDETLEEADDNVGREDALDYAIYLVKIALQRIVDDEGYEGEELQFYQDQLDLISQLETKY